MIKLDYHIKYKLLSLLHITGILITFTIFLKAILSSYVLFSILCLSMFFILIYKHIKHTESYFLSFQDFAESVINQDFNHFFYEDKMGSKFHKSLNSITERLQKINLKSAEQQQFLQTLLDNMPVAIMAVNKSHKITLTNRSLNNMLNFKSLMYLQQLEKNHPGLLQAIQTLQNKQNALIRLNAKELRISMVELNLTSGHQKIYTMESIGKELDSREFNAWHNILRVIAHEIMNSMTPLTSLTQTTRDILLSLDRNDLPEKIVTDIDRVTKALAVIVRRSEGLNYFISAYRKITQNQQPHFSQVPVKPLFDNSIKLLDLEISQYNININIDVQPTTLQIAADSTMMEQVIINLIKNAIEACANQKGEMKIELSAQLRGKDIIITIEDNGIGIDNMNEENIFVPFFTTKKTGSGIGLSVCKQIIRAHSAELVLIDNSKPGTRFQIVF